MFSDLKLKQRQNLKLKIEEPLKQHLLRWVGANERAMFDLS